jgi:hypothetical protein
LFCGFAIAKTDSDIELSKKIMPSSASIFSFDEYQKKP